MKKTIKPVKCHCGKNGHALNSINCPVHKPIKAWAITVKGQLAYFSNHKYLIYTNREDARWEANEHGFKVVPVFITSK